MMYYIFFILLSLAFLARIIVNTLYATWLWQIKEYRLDRLLAHFRETNEGRRFLINKKTIAFTLLFLLTPVTFIAALLPWYVVLATAVFLFDVKEIVYQITTKTIRRPVFTGKAILIVSFTLITFAILFVVLPLSKPAVLVVVDRFIFPTVSLAVFLLAILTMFIKSVLMEMAKRKRAKMKNLIVIGIAGSYGKSSTKDLIAAFLSEKFNVLKTPGSVNTDLGIAQFMLKALKSTNEVFIVEIGAYKRGEITSVCNMVKPKIGVLTGINEQHLSLFGSMENTKKAKYELIESLPKDGMAFFNGDDAITLVMAKQSKLKNSYVYSVKQLPPSVRVSKNPFLSNLSAALFLATKLGVVKEALRMSLSDSINSLGIKKQKKGELTIFDDSFNTNPKGFTAALDVLAFSFGRKILITPGIIELGSQSKRIHEELGEKIGTICDVVILTNDNFVSPIREGLMKTKFDMRNFLIPKREELVSLVKNKVSHKTTILFEGRVPNELLAFHF